MKTRGFISTMVLAFLLSLAMFPGLHAATEGGMAWDKHTKKVTDLPSLQNGAKLFVNYCLSCHSAASMRYNRLQDIGITEQQIKDNLMFTTDKVGETMIAAIDPQKAAKWFGANPPDLTVIARSRAGAGGSGADYLYTFLRTFYRDESRLTGWDNLAFPTVGMPHALWELQGQRRAVFEEVDHNGTATRVFKGWEQITPGKLTEAEYDDTVADLVNYLQWMGEPIQTTRKHIGYGVVAFLLLLTFLTWRLNKAYWREVK